MYNENINTKADNILIKCKIIFFQCLVVVFFNFVLSYWFFYFFYFIKMIRKWGLSTFLPVFYRHFTQKANISRSWMSTVCTSLNTYTGIAVATEQLLSQSRLLECGSIVWKKAPMSWMIFIYSIIYSYILEHDILYILGPGCIDWPVDFTELMNLIFWSPRKHSYIFKWMREMWFDFKL